jgi:hypothetical protein
LKPPAAEASWPLVAPVVEKPLLEVPLLHFEKKEVILRVPRELVMQALKLAIKSGNTSIRVEVVE